MNEAINPERVDDTKRFRLTSIVVALIMLTLMGGIVIAILAGASRLFAPATAGAPVASPVTAAVLPKLLAPGWNITPVRAETLTYGSGESTWAPGPRDWGLIIVAMENANPQLTALRNGQGTTGAILPEFIRPWFTPQLANDLRSGTNVTYYDAAPLMNAPLLHGWIIFHNPSGQVVIVLWTT